MTDALTDEGSYRVEWLRTICQKAGKGTLNSIDARAVLCAVDGLLATISALRAERDELAAAVCVLVDRLGTYIKAYNIACEEDNELEVSRSVLKQITANLPTAAKELMEELERLRANQRTPGTVEVCAQCNARNPNSDGQCPGTWIGGSQDYSQCPVPIRSAAAEQSIPTGLGDSPNTTKD